MKEPSEVKQLQVYIVSDSEAERDTKWVTMLEELPSILSKAMVCLSIFVIISKLVLIQKIMMLL